MFRVIVRLTPVALVVMTALAQEPHPAAGPKAPVASLFASHDLLTFTIEAPLATIFKDRGKERNERPAKLIVSGNDGRPVTLDLDIRTRGKTRAERRICEFPPLRLDFDTAGHGTVFERQNDLKLVTHCQDGRPYEQYVLQEYLVYRVYNLLSDLSFKVRLARVTYIDTDGKRDTVTRHGFLLEPLDAMAARNGWQALRLQGVPPHASDPRTLALVEVFQYMIGNPDWSVFGVEPDEEACCHNTVPIGPSFEGPIFSVPYDFDVSGIVNTRYADRLFVPEGRNIGITRVRQRAYRGLCVSAVHQPAIFALLNEKREAIYALYRGQPGLDAEVVKETLEYLDEFYETINDRRKVEREIGRRCSG